MLIVNERNNTPKVLKEEPNFLVLEKPSGWVVNESINTGKNPVLQDWLSKNFDYEIAKSKDTRSGIVHRLDKETSGLILVAKDKKTFDMLQEQFAKREVKKTYVALVHGKIEEKEGVINEPVGRLPWKRTKFGVFEGGRPAQTGYKVLNYYTKDSEAFTFLELYPQTGRTHQLRVHLKHIGHPIVSDPLYAGRKVARKDRLWCPRLFLHASEIVFNNLTTQKSQSVKSELPPDLKSALNSLSI